MIIALTPLASHAIVWGIVAAASAGVWLARRRAIRALDLRDPEPDPAELLRLFRTVEEDDETLVAGENTLAS